MSLLKYFSKTSEPLPPPRRRSPRPPPPKKRPVGRPRRKTVTTTGTSECGKETAAAKEGVTVLTTEQREPEGKI